LQQKLAFRLELPLKASIFNSQLRAENKMAKVSTIYHRRRNFCLVTLARSLAARRGSLTSAATDTFV
jgi:hypothetical protein